MQSDSSAIIGIVFSKDRALQLDAALRSFFLNCLDPDNISLRVIYTASSDLFLGQYKDLRLAYSENSHVCFIQQKNFEQDVYSAFDVAGSRLIRLVENISAPRRFKHALHKFVLFLVDDNIFIRKLRLSEIIQALEQEKNALGFSLQMGTNINYCYPLDISLKFPNTILIFNDVIKYRWPDAGDGLNYPLEVSSSIYRINEISNLLVKLHFTNPNTLEAQMAAKANEYCVSHPYLLCYKYSVTFCNPVNKVQDIYDNKAGDDPVYSADHLAQLFNDGYRIDIQKYQNMVPRSCHQEVEIIFSKGTSVHD